MIKFFRKNRQKLLSEGNTGKYIQYAIGEIVLVVIGILIALFINNWSEYKKTRATEIVFLKNIKNDIKLTIEEIDEFIEARNAQIIAVIFFLAHFEGKPIIDSDAIKPTLRIEACDKGIKPHHHILLKDTCVLTYYIPICFEKT